MRARKLIAALMLGGMLALPAAPADAATLRFTAAAPALTLDPHMTNDFVTTMVFSQIYDRLVGLDTDLQLVPGLALDWEYLGDRVWRFSLRDGVTFHGGEPFTARDVAFSAERAKQSRFYTAFVGGIEEVRVIDDLTVEFVTAQPDPLFPRKMSRLFVMPEGWTTEMGAAAVPDLGATGTEAHTVRNANGTGLFRVVEHEQGVRTVMARHEGYWREVPSNLTEVVYVPIGSGPTRVAALLSGEVDLVADLPLQDIARVEAEAALKVTQRPQIQNIQLEMDGTRDVAIETTAKDGSPLGANPFKDVRVRLAIAHAVDAPLIVERVMRGSAQVAGSSGVPGTGGYQADLDDRWPTDEDLARSLLAEAGYPDGFRTQLNCPLERYVNAEEICRAVASMLARVGIDVEVNGMVWPDFARMLVNGPDSSFHLIGAGPNGADTQDTFQQSMMTRNPERNEGFFNWAMWSNPEFDAVVHEIVATFDPDRRDELYREGLQIAKDNVHAVYIHRPMITWGLRENIDAEMRSDAVPPLELLVVRE